MRKIKLFNGEPCAIIFIGQSGAGKDTQLLLLKEYISARSDRNILAYISGDHFRKQEKENSYTARIIKEKNSEGKLLSLNWAVMHWSNFLEQSYTGQEHLIFNGSPRQLLEAKLLEAALCDDYGLSPFVIHLLADDETAYQRILKRNETEKRNETSSESSIREKLRWYHEKVLPAVEHIEGRAQFTLIEIDGSPPPDAVFADVVARLFE